MTTSRQTIFENIRRGLKRGELSAEARQVAEQRIQNPQPNLIPARAQLPKEEQIALFVSMAEEAAAEIHRVDSLADIPAAVKGALDTVSQDTLVIGPKSKLLELDWGSTGLTLEKRIAQKGDLSSLSFAFAGVAETGTLMLLSGPENPTTLNFLPDNHLVVLQEQDIEGPYEDAWSRVRQSCGENIPRTVNMVTGPSRSADIEQRLQMGAHGPKRLLIFLIKSPTSH